MCFADIIRIRVSVRISGAVFSILVLNAFFSSAQEFDWTWKSADQEAGTETSAEQGATAAAGSSADVPVSQLDTNGGFGWSWSEGQGDAPVSDGAVSAVERADAAAVRSDEAYQKLLKENLELRRKMAEALKDEELARKENERLAGEISDMEKNLAESVSMIQGLKTSRDTALTAEQVSELQVRLAGAEKARDEMAAELDRLRRMRDSSAVAASGKAGVAEGSDLFKEKEKENDLLKKRLIEIETERRKLAEDAETARKAAEKAAAERDELSEKALAAARQGAEYKKIVDKLPQIEDQVNTLKSDVQTKDEKLSVREQQLAALTVELERREHRLAKAQKMTELLERARTEVQQADNREKLNMHYNMAVIYAKEGRLRDAEDEYLKALRIDPSDADIHYNLGILYDQDLKRADKAVIHYKRYLTLRPNAADADQVKSWILDLEIN